MVWIVALHVVLFIILGERDVCGNMKHDFEAIEVGIHRIFSGEVFGRIEACPEFLPSLQYDLVPQDTQKFLERLTPSP